MGAWTYYAPLWLGTLLAAGLYLGNLGQLPPWPVGVHVLVVVVGAPATGLVLQLAFIGAQGAFAQVLPVPWGRSIRGGAALLSGGLLLAGLCAAVITGLLWSEGLRTGGLVAGILALAGLAGSGGVYLWSLPAAVRDFGSVQEAMSRDDSDVGS